MAQHDYVISNGTGAAVRSDLNNALSAIVTQNSGSTEPTTTYAYQMWADTNAGVMKIRNGANSAWITLYQLDGEWTSIAFENGSAAAPSIYFKDSGTDTGFFSGGTDQVNIATAGTERVEWGTSEVVFNDAGNNYDFRVEGDTNANLLFVDASADAVGIGESAPTEKLVVSGTGNQTVVINTNTSGNPKLLFNAAGYSAGFIQYARSGGGLLQFSGDSSNVAMTIDSSSRVGIGTASPSQLLEVAGSVGNIQLASSGAEITFTRNGPSAITASGASGSLLFQTGGTNERARIDSSGRLLVGTSSALTGSNSQYSKLVALGNSLNANGCFAAFGYGSIGTSLGAGVDIATISFTDNAAGQFASIQCFTDAACGSGDYPGRLVFSVTRDGQASPTESLRISNDGSISSVIPGGSTLYPRFGCRAWVNFNGTGTVAIRGNGNVSSITDNGVGDYTVNFTTAMPDANYASSMIADGAGGPANLEIYGGGSPVLAGSLRINASGDRGNCHVAIFR